jgi:hypothetical protein
MSSRQSAAQFIKLIKRWKNPQKKYYENHQFFAEDDKRI